MSKTTTSDFINTSSREYAIYTAQNRAIPSVCDGLKDGQRKMLWLMRTRSEKVKTISLAGQVIQEGLFVHGDSSAAETISRLAAPYLNNVPLLEGIGAFGTRVGPDSWGAPRYTYVKRHAVAQALLYPDLDLVPQKPNYDGSVLEPVNFLPLIPLVLLNGVSGIAVGWSTDILPHSLESLIDTVVAAIDQKPLPVLVPNYDYLQVNVRDLGGNSYEFKGQVEIVSATLLKVTELPPDLSLEKFRARLNQMEDDDLIHSYVDRSTKTINIEIRMKRGSMEAWTQEHAVNFLKLRSKSTQRLVVLDFNNTSIRQFANAGELVQAFVEWRLTWYTKRYQKLIEQTQRELTWYQALKLCYDQKLPAFLSQAANKQAIVERVQKITSKLPIELDQIDRITQLASYRWAQDQYQDTLDKIAEQEKLLAQYQAMLASPAALRKQYRQEVTALKKLKLTHK